MSAIAENLRIIRERMARAADACGRSPDDIELVAISKTFPKEMVIEAAEAGIRRFGENRVQEAEGKIPHAGRGLEWHLVGHLQSNKARRAVELFDVIHSLDSLKLAEKLNQACLEQAKVLSVLLQVDLAGEETKFGATPDEARGIVEAMPRFQALRLDGLMIIPPYFDDPDDVRPYFARLRKLKEEFESSRPGCLGRQHLSMGMSHDFEQAIQEGATLIRVGTALFGTRA